RSTPRRREGARSDRTRRPAWLLRGRVRPGAARAGRRRVHRERSTAATGRLGGAARTRRFWTPAVDASAEFAGFPAASLGRGRIGAGAARARASWLGAPPDRGL